MIDTEQLRFEGKAAFRIDGSLVAALAIKAADEIDWLRNALKFYAESTEGGNIARAVLAGVELDGR